MHFLYQRAPLYESMDDSADEFVNTPNFQIKNLLFV